MMGTATIQDSEQAADYFDQTDDYYQELGNAPSQWYGRIAADLGLTGEVDPGDFELMLSGYLPTGEQFAKPRWVVNSETGEKEITRRPGNDFSFSASKSVSIMAEVAGDDRVRSAHDRAVARAVEALESRVQGRIKNGNITRRVTTGSAVIATFRHQTSRAKEANLHTHAILINLTENPDGRYRANDPKSIFSARNFLGQVYQSELARELKHAGFQVSLRELKNGALVAEIDGVAEQAINDHSSRSQMIDKELRRQGIDPKTATPQQRDTATLNTRQTKEPGNHAELRAEWQELATQQGYADALQQVSRQAAARRAENAGITLDAEAGNPSESRTMAAAADAAVDHSIEHHQERDSRFSHQDLVTEAMRYAMGRTERIQPGLVDIEAAIERRVAAGQLLLREVRERPGRTYSSARVSGYTTREGMQTERAFLAIEKQGRQAMPPLLSPDEAAQRVADAEAASVYEWTPAQRETTHQVLANSNRIFGVQGFAGSAKTTTVMKTCAEVAREQGFAVRGLAQQFRVASDIEAKVGVDAQTVAGFLLQSRGATPRGEIWLVDEASQLSATDMRDLLRVAENGGNRVIQVGDSQQLGSVEAGESFAQLQDAGMPTAILDSIVRQTNADTREAVEHSIERDAAAALDAVERSGRVHEIGSNGMRQSRDEAAARRRDAMAREYLALSPDARDNTLLIDPSRDGRAALNETVREGLKVEGSLGNDELAMESWERADLTNAAKKDNSSYDIDQIIRFNKARKRDGIPIGDYRVEGRTTDGWLSIRSTQDGSRHTVDMTRVAPRHTRVYESRQIGLAVGDRVQASETDTGRGIRNGDRGTVSRVDTESQTARIMLRKGRDIDIDLSEGQNLRHNYTRTVFSGQGMTSDRVIVHLESWRENLVDQKSLYVSLSRARESISIHTDSRNDLIDAIRDRTGEAERALDRGTEAADDETICDMADHMLAEINERIDALNRSDDTAKVLEQRSRENALLDAESGDDATRADRRVEPEADDQWQPISEASDQRQDDRHQQADARTAAGIEAIRETRRQAEDAAADTADPERDGGLEQDDPPRPQLKASDQPQTAQTPTAREPEKSEPEQSPETGADNLVDWLNERQEELLQQNMSGQPEQASADPGSSQQHSDRNPPDKGPFITAGDQCRYNKPESLEQSEPEYSEQPDLSSDERWPADTGPEKKPRFDPRDPPSIHNVPDYTVDMQGYWDAMEARWNARQLGIDVDALDSKHSPDQSSAKQQPEQSEPESKQTEGGGRDDSDPDPAVAFLRQLNKDRTTIGSEPELESEPGRPANPEPKPDQSPADTEPQQQPRFDPQNPPKWEDVPDDAVDWQGWWDAMEARQQAYKLGIDPDNPGSTPSDDQSSDQDDGQSHDMNL